MKVQTTPPANRVVLQRRQVEERTKLSKSSIYERLNRHSRYYDPRFPRPFRYYPRGRVYWFESEIDLWLSVQASISRRPGSTFDLP